MVATEALQCPTLLQFGFGEHRIEGIGDKHVPWIHNVRNTDLVAAVDDEQTMQLMRLFNEDEGQACLRREGVDERRWQRWPDRHLGPLQPRGQHQDRPLLRHGRPRRDLHAADRLDGAVCIAHAGNAGKHGPYTTPLADQHYGRYLQGTTTDHVRELSYADRKALHNFKYFTWVEQQGRSSDELRQLWDEDFWQEVFSQDVVDEWDRLIDAFNNDGGKQ